ncbi:hypothetical protein [Alkalibacterium sp. MB6]|uniref:hypothetical protein n=1 Tax=Alkalibacterium sp. MB6 TaxID=2081965 RepID=UPI00137A194B|nr:hypothetical protein [Alkalibacterium sp. MB6]
MTAGMLLAACGDAANDMEDPAVEDGLEVDPFDTNGDPATDDGLESETDMDLDDSDSDN